MRLGRWRSIAGVTACHLGRAPVRGRHFDDRISLPTQGRRAAIWPFGCLAPHEAPRGGDRLGSPWRGRTPIPSLARIEHRVKPDLAQFDQSHPAPPRDRGRAWRTHRRRGAGLGPRRPTFSHHRRGTPHGGPSCGRSSARCGRPLPAPPGRGAARGCSLGSDRGGTVPGGWGRRESRFPTPRTRSRIWPRLHPGTVG